MINCVILDMDGTLLDSESISREATSIGFKQIFGRELTDEEHSLLIGRPVQKIMREKYGENGEKAYVIGRDIFNQSIHKIELFPGVLEMLKGLTQHKYSLGLVTSSHRTTAKYFLDKTCISSLFKCIIGQEDTENHKPHPEPLKKCISQLGFTAEQSVYIGDQPYDIEAARAAGMKSIGVTWGPGLENILRLEEPDFICDDPSEVISKLKRL